MNDTVNVNRDVLQRWLSIVYAIISFLKEGKLIDAYDRSKYLIGEIERVRDGN